MAKLDPETRRPCPECGKALTYVNTGTRAGGAYQPGQKFTITKDTHYFSCPDHGRYHVGQDGILTRGL